MSKPSLEPGPSNWTRTGGRRVSPARAQLYRAREQAIIDAAYRQLQSASSISVTEILRETGLSTRAFYRQFETKDDLLVTMCRQEFARMSTRLAAAVASARTPLKAVEAWVREALQAGYDPRRGRRTVLFRSPEARAAQGFELVSREGMAVQREILADSIRAGTEAGGFPFADPENDARAIQAIVDSLNFARLAGEPGPSLEEAIDHLVGVFGRAFGQEVPRNRPRPRRTSKRQAAARQSAADNTT